MKTITINHTKDKLLLISIYFQALIHYITLHYISVYTFISFFIPQTSDFGHCILQISVS